MEKIPGSESGQTIIPDLTEEYRQFLAEGGSPKDWLNNKQPDYQLRLQAVLEVVRQENGPSTILPADISNPLNSSSSSTTSPKPDNSRPPAKG